MSIYTSIANKDVDLANKALTARSDDEDFYSPKHSQ
jgi:hypothetical protein